MLMTISLALCIYLLQSSMRAMIAVVIQSLSQKMESNKAQVAHLNLVRTVSILRLTSAVLKQHLNSSIERRQWLFSKSPTEAKGYLIVHKAHNLDSRLIHFRGGTAKIHIFKSSSNTRKLLSCIRLKNFLKGSSEDLALTRITR